MSEDFLLTPDEACALLGIGRSHLQAMLKRGEIRSITIGKLRRIPRVALDAWLQERLEASSPRSDVQPPPQPVTATVTATDTDAPQVPVRRRKRQVVAD